MEMMKNVEQEKIQIITKFALMMDIVYGVELELQIIKDSTKYKF